MIRARTIQVDVVVVPGPIPAEQVSDVFGQAWAEDNGDRLILALAGLLAVLPEQLQLEVVDSLAQRHLDGRRLQQQVFNMRIQLSDETDIPDSMLVETLLCGLFMCNGSAVIGRTLWNLTVFSVASLVGDGVSSVLFRSLAQDGSDAVDGIIGAEMILDTWEVAVVMDFMLPAAEWLAGTWDACSTDCGEGSTSRTISCTLGGTLGCATMEQPTDKQSCEGSDCPPYCVLLGSKDRASCGAGAVAVVSGGVTLLLASCFVLAAVVWWRRAPPSGERWIPSLGRRLKYRIEEIQHDIVTKTHVIWERAEDLDRGGVSTSTAVSAGKAAAVAGADDPVAHHGETCLVTVVSPGDIFPGVADGTGASVAQSGADSATSSRSVDSSRSQHVTTASGFRLLLGRGIKGPRSPVGDARFGHPAYADGMTVEYFSCTNKCWLLGVVSLDAIYNGKTLVSVLYNVDLGRTRQMRYDVKIDLLRRPPEQGELVEVQRHAGHPWLPGRILKVRWSREGRLYCALLDEPDEHHGNEVTVPGSALRRRYPGDSKVFAYGGHSVGWQRGTMVGGASTPFSVEDFQSLSGQLFMGNAATPIVKTLGRNGAGHLDVSPDERVFYVLIEDRVERVLGGLIDCAHGISDVV